jgi:hypothetical protein
VIYDTNKTWYILNHKTEKTNTSKQKTNINQTKEKKRTGQSRNDAPSGKE